ncbi:hypothetical protein [Pseudobacteriovorax antillogorgiicola]|uniref:Uncharacterized protein n=1 Tax=Pseudobacteriovorax antillogorgiicola TaxID=1513793 RepID=A0A1Y6CE55_9BACT|nr:hypothetical protein [Pseudobacteriovorax antillogorgiicola]TCS47694.1 hypothetical protein EDD56_120135 [Pseudobacteriovorax antillogorgiicola]SMF59470.1 hypothetical protein SAMN06296036_1205 [Pseudobacteriovorax antillogorgiicola]
MKDFRTKFIIPGKIIGYTLMVIGLLGILGIDFNTQFMAAMADDHAFAFVFVWVGAFDAEHFLSSI